MAHTNNHDSCPSWMQTTVLSVSGTHTYCQNCQTYSCGCR
jgi:hypothetical protein